MLKLKVNIISYIQIRPPQENSINNHIIAETNLETVHTSNQIILTFTEIPATRVIIQKMFQDIRFYVTLPRYDIE